MGGIENQKISFMLGVGNAWQCPADEGMEIAFAGRSNAGKSSAINTITGRKSLARTSKQPGRTQQINFFQIGDNDTLRISDLPGYGFARVPARVKRQWGQLIEGYLSKRSSLKGMFIVIDIRRGIGEHDAVLIDWCRRCALPYHLLFTKSDKLSKSAASSTLLKEKRSLEEDPLMSAQTFSSLNRTGLSLARTRATDWLELSAQGTRTGAP